MRTVSEYVKMALAVLLVLTSASLCVLRLMKVQVVDSETYHKHDVITTNYTQKIPATRGEIVDAAGTTIVSNHVSYAVVIDEKNFPSDPEQGNAILLRLTEMLTKAGVVWEDSLPVSQRSPYVFDRDAEESTLKAMKRKIGVNAYATAENCMDILCRNYEISDSYSASERRTLAGIRYTMLDSDFSISNRFELVRGVPLETVETLSDLAPLLQGVMIEQTPARTIEIGDVLPHEIGTTGPIYAEHADEYLAMGYDLDAIVGVSGIEKAMESELQGKDGVRTITFENGVAVADEITDPVVAGHTVQLTVNGEFQRGLQDLLTEFLSSAYHVRYTSNHCGAVVVLDAKTGAILGEATAPTFDLTEYSANYSELLEAPGKPLFNRATMGLYRPGSTFKTITSTAGLNEGVVNAYTSFPCNGTYKYIDTTYHCTGHHNYIAVAPALRVSCNAYFYELARQLGIDKIGEYAKYYGFGQPTGIETNEATGWMASPETYREHGLDWTVGQVLQAGIGNGDTMVTPLQLAVAANTIANKGVRYQPYLVDSIWDYNMTECLHKTEPTVVSRIPMKQNGVYEAIQSGMLQAAANGFPKKYSLQNLGYSVAIKTGTPQFASRVQDSVFIGYAPANDPKIAFAGVVEGGEYSKYMIRGICQLYEEVYGDM